LPTSTGPRWSSATRHSTAGCSGAERSLLDCRARPGGRNSPPGAADPGWESFAVSVYLDHNATSPMRPEVRELLLAELERAPGDPSSVHGSGRAARAVLDQARERVAAALGVHEDEIFFTSGGTESVNLALLGVLDALPRAGGLLTSAIEHSAVL